MTLSVPDRPVVRPRHFSSRFLLAARADAARKDKQGFTPRDMAKSAEKKDVVAEREKGTQLFYIK